MLAALAAWLRGGRAGPLVLALLHALALAVFVHGFLLMRVHLDDRSTAAPALPAPRTKLVWLMIDSLRYDFVVADGRYSCVPGRVCHQGRMPFLANLTTGGGALAFRFVADPPTTTTQRLNSLMTVRQAASAPDAFVQRLAVYESSLERDYCQRGKVQGVCALNKAVCAAGAYECRAGCPASSMSATASARGMWSRTTWWTSYGQQGGPW